MPRSRVVQTPSASALQRPTIRRARPDDAADIAHIRVRSWQAAYRDQLDNALLDAMSPAADEQRWHAHLSAPPRGWHGFVAERAGRTVGYLTGGPARDTDAGSDVGEIYAIYVRPEDVGTGVGRALLDRVTDALAGDGYRQLTLWVLATNTPAQRFYRRAGFEPDGGAKRDELGEFAVDEIRFSRPLA